MARDSVESEILNIMNVSEQTISIQLSAVGVDFYKGQQQAHLAPGKSISIDSKYLINGQVDNLRSRSMLKVSTIKPR
jgi:hypothetical protein